MDPDNDCRFMLFVMFFVMFFVLPVFALPMIRMYPHTATTYAKQDHEQ